jgi:hypothetical protein
MYMYRVALMRVGHQWRTVCCSAGWLCMIICAITIVCGIDCPVSRGPASVSRCDCLDFPLGPFHSIPAAAKSWRGVGTAQEDWGELYTGVVWPTAAVALGRPGTLAGHTRLPIYCILQGWHDLGVRCDRARYIYACFYDASMGHNTWCLVTCDILSLTGMRYLNRAVVRFSLVRLPLRQLMSSNDCRKPCLARQARTERVFAGFTTQGCGEGTYVKALLQRQCILQLLAEYWQVVW